MSEDTEPGRASRSQAAQRLESSDATGWFEQLYAAAAGNGAQIPWDRDYPTAPLVEWDAAGALNRQGQRALVVGCGPGRDAEYLAGRGLDTVAFDISPTGIRTAKQRHPDSPVQYVVADLLDPPADWTQGFDLVVECTTVQSLPIGLHADAIQRVASLVAPGGTLLVIAFGREPARVPEGPPWPLTRAEIEAFGTGGLEPVRIEDLRGDPADPEDRRWRAEFSRPVAG